MTKKNLWTPVLATALVLVGLVIGVVVSASLTAGWAGTALNQKDWRLELTALDERIANLPDRQQAFVLVAKRVTPAVVTISSERKVRSSDMRMRIPEEFRRFFGDDDLPFDSPGGEQILSGLGSGVIVDPDGVILTNNHVVDKADKIQVTLSDRRKVDAEVVGTDPASDLAVIRVKEKGLPSVNFGDSEAIEVGEWVLAVGNPFSDVLRHTVTAGIVSAKGREGLVAGPNSYEDFIQTDAAINPGNSGGALVNLRGELIGINTAIVSRSGSFDGVGFAIPSNLAKSVMDSLLKHGRVIRGWLGVTIQSPDDMMAEQFGLDRPTGALISSVAKDSPADKADLRRGDLVLTLNGKEIETSQDLMNRIGMMAPGTEVTLGILRDDRKLDIKIILGERPENLGEETAQAPSGETGDILDKIGMTLTPLTDRLAERLGYEDEQGVVIARVRGGSAAARAGLRQGDLIQEVNRKTVRSMDDFNELIADYGPGDAVLLYILRGDTGGYVAVRIPE